MAGSEQQSPAGDDFSRSVNQAQPGFLAECWAFLMKEKKWWITPMVVLLLIFGLLVMLSGTAAAPFIYTLF